MATHDIPREQWKTFFEDFSRRHQGRARVTVEAVDPKTQPHVEANALPFVGLSFEEKGSDTGSIVLLLGAERGDHVKHSVENPRHVYHKAGAGVLSSEVNPDEILEITAPGDPPILFLHFRHDGE